MEDILASEDSIAELKQNILSRDMIMAISDFVDAISANPGTAPSDSETTQLSLAETSKKVVVVREIPFWVQSMMAYLAEGILLEDETQARKLQRKSKSYTIINSEVYRRSVTGVLQRCMEPAAGQEILLDVHQGNVSIIYHPEHL